MERRLPQCRGDRIALGVRDGRFSLEPRSLALSRPFLCAPLSPLHSLADCSLVPCRPSSPSSLSSLSSSPFLDEFGVPSPPRRFRPAVPSPFVTPRRFRRRRPSPPLPPWTFAAGGKSSAGAFGKWVRIPTAPGPIAQWWSRGLIIPWLQVRALLGPPRNVRPVPRRPFRVCRQPLRARCQPFCVLPALQPGNAGQTRGPRLETS